MSHVFLGKEGVVKKNSEPPTVSLDSYNSILPVNEEHLDKLSLIRLTTSMFIPTGVISLLAQSFRHPPAGDGRPKGAPFVGGHSSLSVTHSDTCSCV
jgi:hypothetical protein